MGHDEHGPAYPEPAQHHELVNRLNHRVRAEYRCPICRGNENRYLECEYPGCPDGRDRTHPHAVARRQALLRETYPTEDELKVSHPVARCLVGAAIVIAFVIFMIWPRSAPAMDHGFDPTNKTVKWMETLQQPNYPGSCCGKADGYPVSEYWDNHDGTWTAVIGDGSAKKFPDGTTREYIATGEKVIVPIEKVNKYEDDLDNPTDVSWLFMTVHAAEPGTIYCFIRHPSGN